jgi:RNA polymerase primary sigma factor
MSASAPILRTPELAWNIAARHDALALHWAGRFARKHRTDLDDLKQQAWLALYHAALRFDATRGLKFSTYATSVIRTQLRELVLADNILRVPVRVHTLANKVRRSGIDPSELADGDRVRLARGRAVAVPMGDDFDVAEDAEPAEIPRRELTPELLDGLDERYRRVIVEHHGLFGAEAATLNEIARRMGVTRQRAQQIHAKGIRQLRMAVA